MSQQELDILIVMVGGTISFLVLSTFFIVLVYRYQKRMQQKQLELFNAVMEAQELEQERIARDLHDQLGPSLSIIKTQIDSMDEAGLSVIDKRIKNETTLQLTEAIREVRSIAHNLIPKTYSEYGFIRSLEYYIVRLKEFARLEVNFTHTTWPDGIEKAYEVSLYRIIQELFQNTLKHSGATEATLNIDINNKQLTMAYTDNGKGIQEEATINPGIGLKNIASRVNMLGGTFNSISQPRGVRFEFVFNPTRLYGRK